MLDLDIDAQSFGNETRFINDCGTIGDQNVKFELEKDEHDHQPRLCAYTTAPVCAGAELLCDYGKKYWRVQQKKVPPLNIYF